MKRHLTKRNIDDQRYIKMLNSINGQRYARLNTEVSFQVFTCQIARD